MKKIICLIMAIMMIFCVCACGETSGNNNAGNNNQTDANQQSQAIDIETEEAYVGEWVHERKDEEPFSMNLTLKAGGKGSSGKNTSVDWSFDEAEKKISIELVFPDGSKDEVTYAKLIEENTLSWERKFTIKLADDQFIEVEKVIFKRVK